MLFLAIATIALYFCSGFMLLRHWRAASQPNWANYAAYVAAAGHIVITISHSYSGHAVNFSLFSVSNIISLCLVAAVLLISLFLPVRKLVGPLLVLAAANILFTLIPSTTEPTLISTDVALHVIPSLVAYSIFSLAALQAGVLWMQHRALKNHQFNTLFQDLPSIDVLEQMLIAMLIIGFALLTASIVTGSIGIDNFWGQHLAHKTLFSVLAWLTYGALLLGRFILGWRATTVVKWTIGGFIFMMLGFFGSKFVLELIL